MTNDGGGSGAPRFDVVLRGYDRRQVDEHVARMQRIIGRMRADLELARSQPLPIVTPAAAEPNGARPPRPTPRPRPGEQPDVVGSFTDRMQSILQAAEEEAAEIRRKAQTSARSELQAARGEVADLARQRDIMVTELNRLRGQLESMLSAPTAKMTPVHRNGAAPSPTRRDGKPRPSPTPRGSQQGQAQPAQDRPGRAPIARQAVTGPQQLSPPPPPVSDAAVTQAAPAVAEDPVTVAAPVPDAGVNGATRNGAAEPPPSEEAPPTTVVRVAGEPRGKTASARGESEKPAADDRPTVEATVKVAAVRPEPERPEPEQSAPSEAHSPSRSG